MEAVMPLPPFHLKIKNMIDNDFTKEIIAFLDIPEKSDDDILTGAKLLLQINRNQALFQNICRKPQKFIGKLEYELKKHLKYRMDGRTLEEVRKMDAEVTPEVENLIKEVETPADDKSTSDSEVPAADGEESTTRTRHGKRADHDSLPEEIKQIWDANIDRYKKIKETFETCKLLDQSCDRYEHLVLLTEEYKKYRDTMYQYDTYKVTPTDPAAQATAISSARAYISKSMPALDMLIEMKDEDNIAKLKAKMQDRLNILISNNAKIGDDLKEWFKSHDFNLQ